MTTMIICHDCFSCGAICVCDKEVKPNDLARGEIRPTKHGLDPRDVFALKTMPKELKQRDVKVEVSQHSRPR